MISHDDVALMANAIFDCMQEYSDLCRDKNMEEGSPDWIERMNKVVQETIRYDDIINEYQLKAELPPPSCMHLEVLYLLSAFVETQREAAEYFNESRKFFPGTESSQTYGAFNINIKLNAIMKYVLAIRSKLEKNSESVQIAFEKEV